MKIDKDDLKELKMHLEEALYIVNTSYLDDVRAPLEEAFRQVKRYDTNEYNLTDDELDILVYCLKFITQEHQSILSKEQCTVINDLLMEKL